ncbi:MAG: hypothetical protein IKX28_08440 [Bacteroidales bacterium]|nr:hypothetical protein [Bacteroidales bacterium]
MKKPAILVKKTLVPLVLCLASFSLLAQSRVSCSLEFVAGVGIGKGPLATFAPEFVAQYDLGGGFRAGAGAGVRYAKPCLQYVTRDGSPSRTFCNELGIPVFLRLGYGKERFYANLDAGYAISVLSYYAPDRPQYYASGSTPSEGKKEFHYNGLFVEPQVGWRIGRRSALALGLLLQKSVVINQVTTQHSDFIYSEGKKLNVFTPAVTLRYVLGF